MENKNNETVILKKLRFPVWLWRELLGNFLRMWYCPYKLGKLLRYTGEILGIVLFSLGRTRLDILSQLEAVQ